MEQEKVKYLIDLINNMDIKDKLRLAICMSQSKWSGLIYNTNENYQKFDSMLKEIDEEYRATQTSGSNFGYASDVTSNNDSGGAGGGYYGGLVTNNSNGGGGGGSGFISGLKGCVAIKSSSDTSPRLDSNNEVCADGTTDITCSKHYSGKVFRNAKLIAGDKSMPDYDSETNGTMIGNINDGHARITYIRF